MQLKLYYFYRKVPNGYRDKLAHHIYFLSYDTIEEIYSNIMNRRFNYPHFLFSLPDIYVYMTVVQEKGVI